LRQRRPISQLTSNTKNQEHALITVSLHSQQQLSLVCKTFNSRTKIFTTFIKLTLNIESLCYTKRHCCRSCALLCRIVGARAPQILKYTKRNQFVECSAANDLAAFMFCRRAPACKNPRRHPGSANKGRVEVVSTGAREIWAKIWILHTRAER
jgi:hypothetical protein